MTIGSLTFADPWYLLILIVIPVQLWRIWSLSGRGRVPIPTASAVTALPSLKASLWWLPAALRLLAIVAVVGALARPQVPGEEVIEGQGVDIMLALDMSGSMNAIDMAKADLETLIRDDEKPKNRFVAARDTLKEFIVARSRGGSDRIGLVIFGEEAWLKYALTHDDARLVRVLNRLVLDDSRRSRRDGGDGGCMNGCTISGAGTAIGDALGRAYNRLKRSDGASKIILLITDGKQQGGTLDAAALARHIRTLPQSQRVRIYTFLVGGKDQVWVPDLSRFGALAQGGDTVRYVAPAQPFDTDPELLKDIAAQTGGRFYESYNDAKFKEDIADLERTVFNAEIERPHHDVFFFPLLIGLLLLASEWLLRFTLFRSVV